MHETRTVAWGNWIQFALLVLALVSAIGGGVMVAEARSARTETLQSAADRQAADHELRLRRIEERTATLDGKIDLILDRLGVRRP